ncbi:MAG: molybdopterin cofactor-binding domain-containing protein, partial [Woeseiaceae bacterium]
MTTRREFIRASGALTISFVVPCATAASTRIRPIGEMFVRSRLRLYAKGEVHLLMGKAELGQGIGTAMAQIVAEELDVGIDSVRLDPVSTLGSPDESYTTGSISVQQSGPPTRRAAATARAFLLGEGSAQLGVNVDRLSVRNGRILVDGT